MKHNKRNKHRGAVSHKEAGHQTQKRLDPEAMIAGTATLEKNKYCTCGLSVASTVVFPGLSEFLPPAGIEARAG